MLASLTRRRDAPIYTDVFCSENGTNTSKVAPTLSVTRQRHSPDDELSASTVSLTLVALLVGEAMDGEPYVPSGVVVVQA